MSGNPPRQPTIKQYNLGEAGVSSAPETSHNISPNLNNNPSPSNPPIHLIQTPPPQPIQINHPIHAAAPVAGNVVLMYNNSPSPNSNHKNQSHPMKRIVPQQQQMGQPTNGQLAPQKPNPKILTRPNTPPINYNVNQLQLQQQQQQQLLPIHHIQQQQLLQQQMYCQPTQQQLQMQAIHSPGRNYIPNGANVPASGQIIMTQQQQIQFQIQQQQMIQQQQQQLQQIQQQQYQQQQQLQQIQHPINNNSNLNDVQIPTNGKNPLKSAKSSKSDQNSSNSSHSGKNANSTSHVSGRSGNSSKAKGQSASNASIKSDNSTESFVAEPPSATSAPEAKDDSKIFNALVREPPPVSAAIYPLLPNRREVQLNLKKVEVELRETRQRLIELKNLKQQNFPIRSTFDGLDPKLKVQNHLGMIISHSDVNKVIESNKRTTCSMHDKYRVTNPRVEQRVLHHSHLYYLQRNIDTNAEFVELLFNAAFNWKKLGEEKGRLLARQYAEMRQIWENESKALNYYHKELRETIEKWPTEMIPLLPKPKDNAHLLQFTAPDQPMYLDDVEFYSYAFHSMNAFVPDPEKAHREYKKRLTWTANEKQIFLDKYRLHPREFKKIAAGLQNKTVKDVIEYYYCHRIDLNLKEIEQQSKKRGRKKVVTEGSVRK